MASSIDILELLQRPATEVAPFLLGALVRHESPEGPVVVRLTEVEAYLGPKDSQDPDPGAHTYRGKTERNSVMFGPPGHLYVYFSYGMHFSANLVCRPEGTSSGCLMRAGEIVEGLDLARLRRPTAKRDSELAQGPARLAKAMGFGREHNGIAALGGEVTVTLPERPATAVMAGPRVGISGAGGTEEYPWRFWIGGDPTVSKFKPGVVRPPRRRAPAVQKTQ
ncbi:DNA-3-methyladenine glycosylase [Arthrobacter silviterrae]|uniref:Putative 3-methyladenine DNA glycosylase n=1 Tax=Arthrobacter silviterrae TaxID=2026658 RepID=A0ABX0D4K9_9MICC|nr:MULTISPECIES: DNA-3-methyladenine glycosylase [Arthrobacter]MCU6479504.1 DNA-3-methyladenine glycosylase [Arthrobacter sp. A2-55]MDQ0279671.1 DNA-3-methyladenine glycosylase [Arthrobacter silviterrae]NGN81853.1 DNA-3-methyladenine glycosylase [Arthrobacter silviterrae]